MCRPIRPFQYKMFKQDLEETIQAVSPDLLRQNNVNTIKLFKLK